jgi:hypothetical protein
MANATGGPVPCTGYCGDGKCDADESCTTCYADCVNPINGTAGQTQCVPSCGDGYCQPNSRLRDGTMGAETCLNCPEDCGGGDWPVCNPETNEPIQYDPANHTYTVVQSDCEVTAYPDESDILLTNCSECCNGPSIGGSRHHRQRTCAANCHWNDWSACDGQSCWLGDTCTPQGVCNGGAIPGIFR